MLVNQQFSFLINNKAMCVLMEQFNELLTHFQNINVIFTNDIYIFPIKYINKFV